MAQDEFEMGKFLALGWLKYFNEHPLVEVSRNSEELEKFLKDKQNTPSGLKILVLKILVLKILVLKILVLKNRLLKFLNLLMKTHLILMVKHINSSYSKIKLMEAVMTGKKLENKLKYLLMMRLTA